MTDTLDHRTIMVGLDLVACHAYDGWNNDHLMDEPRPSEEQVLALMARLDGGAVVIPAAVLRTLIGAAQSYAEDLASGLDDGTYEDDDCDDRSEYLGVGAQIENSSASACWLDDA